MSRFTKRDRYGHAYTNETIYDRGMTSKDGKIYEKHYFENGTSAYDGKPIDRLCELEDKIEKGDVVEVVRCKECKWCEDLLMSGLYCNHPDNRNPINCLPTDFCNCGERREE